LWRNMHVISFIVIMYNWHMLPDSQILKPFFDLELKKDKFNYSWFKMQLSHKPMISCQVQLIVKKKMESGWSAKTLISKLHLPCMTTTLERKQIARNLYLLAQASEMIENVVKCKHNQKPILFGYNWNFAKRKLCEFFHYNRYLQCAVNRAFNA
jgi:hypothetical protein